MKKIFLYLLLFISFSPTYAQRIETLANTLGITIIYNKYLNDIARAYTDQEGIRYVEINPSTFFSEIWQIQYFFYAHECYHHILGHTVGFGHPLTNESDADCGAIQYLVRNGYFNKADIQVLQYKMQFYSGDWTHAPGPKRAADLMICFEIEEGFYSNKRKEHIQDMDDERNLKRFNDRYNGVKFGGGVSLGYFIPNSKKGFLYNSENGFDLGAKMFLIAGRNTDIWGTLDYLLGGTKNLPHNVSDDGSRDMLVWGFGSSIYDNNRKFFGNIGLEYYIMNSGNWSKEENGRYTDYPSPPLAREIGTNIGVGIILLKPGKYSSSVPYSFSLSINYHIIFSPERMSYFNLGISGDIWNDNR